jgi:creatinine amidohydrolase
VTHEDGTSPASPERGRNDIVELRRLTTTELGALFATGRVVVLVPVGSVEPHGPHLPLGTDTTLGEESCARAARELSARGTRALVAPAVAYGVTDYAQGFAGAVGIDAETLTSLLAAIGTSLLREGFAHVCFVSHHLEPAHDAAVRATIARLPEGAASVASPLTRRWGAQLSDEYKSGACHAGQYETSLALAAGERVRDEAWSLPALSISLSAGIRAGKKTFRELGMDRAYTGRPASASREEGDALYVKHVAMIVTEVETTLNLTPK